MKDRLNHQLQIRGRQIGDDQPVYVIAEMACAHQGDPDQAKQLIDVAVEAGADAVQLQIFRPEANMLPTADIYPLLQKLAFTWEQWHDIYSHARRQDIAVSIFAYDEPSIEYAISLQPDLLKLNSSELSHPEMIVSAAESRIPYTIGTGASSLDEISAAVDISLAHGGKDMILMHGMQNFPTRMADAHVRKIRTLKEKFGGLVIFADHTDAEMEISVWIDLLALGMGAALLEKHIILDRSKKGVDWQAALQQQELKKYINAMRAGWQALGSAEYTGLTENELKYRAFQKKKIIAATDLPAQTPLTRDKVIFIRTNDGQGVSPSCFSSMEGRILTHSISRYSPVLPDDLSDE